MENIQEYLEKMCDEKTLEKRRANSVIPVCLVLAGTVVLLYGILAELSDTISNALIIIGFIVALLGFAMVFRLFDKKSGHYVYAPTKSRIRTRDIYISSSDKETCRKILENSDFASLENVGRNNNSLTMLKIAISDDNHFAALQMYESDMGYSPTTQCVTTPDSEVAHVRNFLNKQLQ
ncbi:MAG: hypothetical protein J6W45_05820 [Bacteroidales bacterium]|nr:hypothetical protein [Bacteroidales bacterium]